MDISSIRQSKAIIEQVERVLQTAYSANTSFNEALDVASPLYLLHGLEPDQKYKYTASEILYWVDRNTYFDELDQWEGREKAIVHEETLTFLKDSDQTPTFLNLVDAVERRRIAPFVGAGLSCACGYPSWDAALRKLAVRLDGVRMGDIQPDLDAGDYLRAAQTLFNASPSQFKNFIKTEFRPRPGTDDKPAIVGPSLLLPEISHGCIVTTNFDAVIEEVFSQAGQMLDGYMHGNQPGNNFVQRLLRGERCILKLHGDALQENSYVFTEEEYLRAYGDPLSFRKQLPRALRQIFISHSLLFLGCSLEEDKTLDLFKKVVDEGQFEVPDHYAILPKPATPEAKAAKTDRLLGIKIQPIWYEPDASHSMVEKLVRLVGAASRHQVALV